MSLRVLLTVVVSVLYLSPVMLTRAGDRTEGTSCPSCVAAVYEHQVILNPEPHMRLSLTAALKHMMRNLKVYEEQAVQAAEQVGIPCSFITHRETTSTSLSLALSLSVSVFLIQKALLAWKVLYIAKANIDTLTLSSRGLRSLYFQRTVSMGSTSVVCPSLVTLRPSLTH